MMIIGHSYKLPVPCIRAPSGPHLQTFQTTCQPSQLISFLGHDPRSTNWKALPTTLRIAYGDHQRRTKQSRTDNIAKYINDRLKPGSSMLGAFPALSIGLTEAPHFEPLREKAGLDVPENVYIDDSFGTLYLELGPKHNRMLLDGLARFSGAMEYVDDSIDVDEWFSFTLTIFAPRSEQASLTLKDLSQLFFDFNYRVTRVPPSQALAMDQASPYSRILDSLIELPALKENGGVQISGASLGAKSTALVVRRVLHGFVTIAAEGERALQGSKNEEIRNPLTTQENMDEVEERIAIFLTAFAKEMDERFKDQNSIHLTRLGWEAIGMIAHETAVTGDMDGEAIQAVTRKLAAVDWSRTNRDWFGMIGMAETDKQGQPVLENGKEKVVLTGGKGDQALKKMIAYLKKKVSLRQKPTFGAPSLFVETEAAEGEMA